MTDADIVRAALVSARERAQKAEAERDRLREALEALLEWAEKDRAGGYPQEDRSEEWYLHRDFARRALKGGHQ